MAVHGVKGLGWFVCGVIVAPACYVVTSYGAAERAKLSQVEASIRAAEKEIRSLETEFSARASQAQIEQWNGTVLALAAPNAEQFMANEEELANLGAAVPGRPETRLAAVVPAAAPEVPVETAVAEAGAVKHGTAAAAGGGPGLSEARTQAVAMLDDKLLSELRQLAASEKQQLR